MGKTVTTYLIDGDPKGTQYVFISNKICQMYVIPRSNLTILNERQELQTPAFYILLGEDEATKPKAYIGETENFRERVKDHDSKKAFWQKALLFISKDAAMTKADVQYLERQAIKLATDCAHFGVINEQSGTEISLSKYQIDIMEEFFDDVKLLASFIGCPIFEKQEMTKLKKGENLFHIKVRDCDAHAIYNETDHSLRILKGSLLPQSTVPSYRDGEKRNAIIAAMSKPTKDGFWELQRDYVVNSPSTAASYCSGRSCNGWIHWINDAGQSLDDLYRSE